MLPGPSFRAVTATRNPTVCRLADQMGPFVPFPVLLPDRDYEVFHNLFYPDGEGLSETRTPAARPGPAAVLPEARREKARPSKGGRVMKKAVGGIIVVVLAALGTSACAYVGPSAEAKHWERYKEYAPKFTDEEKRNMTLDEKLAIYNAHVAPSERLSCAEGNITGSHQKVVRCFTNAELESQQEAARDFMLAARRGSSM